MSTGFICAPQFGSDSGSINFDLSKFETKKERIRNSTPVVWTFNYEHDVIMVISVFYSSVSPYVGIITPGQTLYIGIKWTFSSDKRTLTLTGSESISTNSASAY